jgi:Bax protein
MRSRIVLGAALAISLLSGPVAAQLKDTDERVPCKDYKDVLALFDRLNYTPQVWQAGIREVPRVFLSDVPDTWRERSAKGLTTLDKKRIFFRVIAPIVLRVNEVITSDRARAKELTERLAVGESIKPEDQAWLGELAVRYRLLKSPNDRLDPDKFAELLLRVDIVPPSLSLAQAASESGWATSRFAAEGNSLFGQWTWGKGKGIKPAEQRADTHGDHRIAAFGTTAEAAYAYALNLNTQDAYRDLRLRRADLRRKNLRISGSVLAETLLRYSERGQAYVDDLKNLMRQNRLEDTDDAYLKDMPVIRIVATAAKAGTAR